jgi:hypothetical protein
VRNPPPFAAERDFQYSLSLAPEEAFLQVRLRLGSTLYGSAASGDTSLHQLVRLLHAGLLTGRRLPTLLQTVLEHLASLPSTLRDSAAGITTLMELVLRLAATFLPTVGSLPAVGLHALAQHIVGYDSTLLDGSAGIAARHEGFLRLLTAKFRAVRHVATVVHHALLQNVVSRCGTLTNRSPVCAALNEGILRQGTALILAAGHVLAVVDQALLHKVAGGKRTLLDGSAVVQALEESLVRLPEAISLALRRSTAAEPKQWRRSPYTCSYSLQPGHPADLASA